MTADSLLANVADLNRLAWLELLGYFPQGYTMKAGEATLRYVGRIVWLKYVRSLPGAPAYPGPRQA